MKNPTDTQSPDLKIRSPLRRKVLLPVATMIIVMITVALFVVNKVVHNQVQQEVTNDLKQKLRAFDSLQRGQQELLAQRAVVLAETPHLRAAIETFHPETIQRELTRIISSRTDSLVLILDPQEHTLATFGENTSDIAAFPLDQFFAQKAIAGAQLGIAIVGNAFWQVALAPVLMPAMVPRIAAPVALTAATCSDSFAASMTCRLPSSSTYHFVENPAQTVTSFEALNE